MNDDRRKLLTEYLGECWHEVKRPKNEPTVFSKSCIKCKRRITIIRNDPIDRDRTFTTPYDFFALKDTLVERGEWKKFNQFCLNSLDPSVPQWKSETAEDAISAFTDWFLNAPRFCELAGEWLEGKEKP